MRKGSETLAEEYYRLMGEKNVEGIKKYLHSEVEFCSPLATLKGREAVVKANSNFMDMIASLKIRAKFGAKDQAMVVYDTDIPGMSRDFPGASLLTFRDGLIVRIELFFDGSHFTDSRVAKPSG